MQVTTAPTTKTTAGPAPRSAPSVPTSADPQSAQGVGVVAFYDGGGARQYDTGNGATGVQGPQRSYSGLSAEQQRSIARATQEAITMVPRAMAQVRAAMTTPNAAVTRAFKLTGERDDDNEALRTVLANYARVAVALSQSLSYEHEASPAENGSVTIAYVYTGFVGLFDGNIHICFPGWDVIASQPGKQATTIIHELTHQVCGTADNAYVHETGKWDGMSMKDAVNNAASYEYILLRTR